MSRLPLLVTEKMRGGWNSFSSSSSLPTNDDIPPIRPPPARVARALVFFFLFLRWAAVLLLAQVG
jgi:hypothetical protein